MQYRDISHGLYAARLNNRAAFSYKKKPRRNGASYETPFRTGHAR